MNTMVFLVQHDTDIRAARFLRGNAIRFNELRFFQILTKRHDGGIEPLQVADLKHEAPALRQFDQHFGLFERCRYRFLDQ